MVNRITLLFLGCKMRFKTSNMDVEVSYKKSGNELLVQKPEIRMRTEDGKLVEEVRVVADSIFRWKGKNLASEIRLIDPDTQEQVPSPEAVEILKHYGYKYFDEAGNEVKKVQVEKRKTVLPVLYYVVQEDGSEEEVSPFPRTSVIEIIDENWVPSTGLNGYEIESTYEIFSDVPIIAKRLFEEAEERLKADQVGMTTFSWGGFTAYYAFLCPVFKDGKFVWLMKLSSKKTLLNHLQDPPTKVKVPIRAAPTIKALPPVQLLVAVAKKKQKK